MNRRRIALAGALTLALALTTGALSLRSADDPALDASESVLSHEGGDESARVEPIQPLVAPRGLDRRKVALGARLFQEPRLSADGQISCASCHDLERGGADTRIHSRGVGGREGEVNAPTVFNSAGNFRQFWDGRARSLEEQIAGPLDSSREMGSSFPEALRTLSADASYRAAFAAIYPEGIDEAAMKDALATFERSLVTTGSRFDRFLLGEAGALSAAEREGYALFKSSGCASCHQGANVGGNMFATLGIMGDYFADRGHLTQADQGRYNVTKRPEDRFRFRVPSLRLVSLTAPYLHDGSAATLEEAIDTMARYQLGRELPPVERDRILLFLRTLAPETNEVRHAAL